MSLSERKQPSNVNPRNPREKFNKHLLDCCSLIVDDAYWPGDRKVAGKFRAMITEAMIPIEAKGIDTRLHRNRLKIWMTTNQDWVVNQTTIVAIDGVDGWTTP